MIDVHEIPLGPGIGLDGSDMTDARLVATTEDLAELHQAIGAALDVARRVSPAEAGTGPCPRRGCITPGAHVHRPATTGNAPPPEQAARRELTWTPDEWSSFLRERGVGQVQALGAIRAHARRHGEDLPLGLRSVAGRPDLVRVLLELADDHVSAAQVAGEPW